MVKNKYIMTRREWSCPGKKCNIVMTIETDIKYTKRPKCRTCGRLMIEIEQTEYE